MVKARSASKVLTQQKRRRRQWLTFLRMCRYGVNNFSRNAWLTIAATAVMTITLLIIFITMAARNVLTESVLEISKNVDMSIYLKSDVTDKQASSIMSDIKKLSNVQAVNFVSSDDARAQQAEQNKGNPELLSAINQATNKLPATIRINLKDINDTSQLDTFVKTNTKVKEVIDPNRSPSFAGSRRSAIQNIGKWTDFAQQVGLGASIVFIAISSLIVFNTIRMAIFNRKEEIQMMKLIGADRNFIRGPFVVEAMVYGFIAAVLATGMGIAILYGSKDGLQNAGVAVQSTIDFITTYIGFVLLIMIALGCLVGTVSSLLATRRYLKI
ncbi:MAG: permease-like cell division protein FtsX [Candidatus Saccharimonas sp.]